MRRSHSGLKGREMQSDNISPSKCCAKSWLCAEEGPAVDDKGLAGDQFGAF